MSFRNPLVLQPPIPHHNILRNRSCKHPACFSGGHADAKRQNKQSGGKKRTFWQAACDMKRPARSLALHSAVWIALASVFSLSLFYSLSGATIKGLSGAEDNVALAGARGRSFAWATSFARLLFSLSLCLPPWNPSTLAFPPNPPTSPQLILSAYTWKGGSLEGCHWERSALL